MRKKCGARPPILISIALWLFNTAVLTAQQAPVAIDIKTAIERARSYSPQFQSASLAVDLARIDRYVAKMALYPSANYFNQYIYTQGNGTPSGIFVSNDGVHVYNSQATVHQDVYTPTKIAEYRQAVAAQAVAAAKKDLSKLLRDHNRAEASHQCAADFERSATFPCPDRETAKRRRSRPRRRGEGATDIRAA
jgi:outer membrane protein TolC